MTIERIALGDDGSLHPTGELETFPSTRWCWRWASTPTWISRNVADIEIGRDDTIMVDAALMTGRLGIFAGGDVIGGIRTMTAATGHGKKAGAGHRCLAAWRDL